MELFDFSEDDSRDPYKDIAKDAKEYAQLNIQLLKLNLLGILSQIASYLVVIVVAALLAMGAFLYLSMVVVVWMKELTGSWMYGFLLMGIVFIILLVLFVLLRRKLLLKPITKKMSDVLFSKEVDIEKEEKYLKQRIKERGESVESDWVEIYQFWSFIPKATRFIRQIVSKIPVSMSILSLIFDLLKGRKKK